MFPFVFLRLCISLLLFTVAVGFSLHRRQLSGSHNGLRTRRGALPPYARDPTFHPRTSPLRSSPRPLRVSTRSRRIPLLGGRHRPWCHTLLAGLALPRFVLLYLHQARRTCFTTAYSARTRIVLASSFLSSSTGFALDPKYSFRAVVRWHLPYRRRDGPQRKCHGGVQDGLRRCHNFRVEHQPDRLFTGWSAWDGGLQSGALHLSCLSCPVMQGAEGL